MCASWNTQASSETNQDDGWADFGGFESAQPIPPSLSSSISTGTIPWVTAGIPLASTTEQRQDSIQGGSVIPPPSHQNIASSPWVVFPDTTAPSALQSIPDVVKTEAVSTSMTWGASMGVPEHTGATHSAAPEKPDDSMPWNQVQDAAASNNRDMLSGQDQNMPWEMTSTSTSSSESPAQSASAAVSDVPWGLHPNTGNGPVQSWPGDVSRSQAVQDQSVTVDGGPVQVSGAGNMQSTSGPTSVPDFVKQREMELLEQKHKECESLEEKNKALENELEHQRIILQEQTKKYDLLQTKHQDQLKVLRDSGQEAFAVIVEEYKQLSKTAVEEQKEQCLKYMKCALEEERKKCEELLQNQHEYLMKLLDQEREENANRVESAVNEIKEKYESQLALAVEEERKQGKEHMNKSVQEEREERERALEEFIEKEREAMEKLTKDHKDETQSMMEEERQKCNELIKEALEQEEKNVKQMLEEAVKEERKKAEEMVKQTLEMTKREMDNYVQQRLRDDAMARQKYLLSMDLFLEGTRTQLHSLMEEDKSQDSDKTE